MTIGLVDNLLEASCALLTAQERLLNAEREESELAYELAVRVMCLARDAIHQALMVPGDVRQRFDLLMAARELDGVDAPLTMRAAAALTECGTTLEAIGSTF